MAANSVDLRFLYIAAVLIMTAANGANALIETTMSFYLQFTSNGPKATYFPVAGNPGEVWSSTQFGTIYVHDDPITEGPDPDSAPVGRAQGMQVVASSDGNSSLVLMSFVFTDEAYNGSTLQIYGTSKETEAVREVPVVSGTGKFRYASGYALLQNYLVVPDSFAVIQCFISLLHY